MSVGPVAQLWLHEGVLAAVFSCWSAAFLSLDPVRLAARMVLNWGLFGSLKEDEFWVLDYWWSTADPLDLSCVTWLQPWYYLWPMHLKAAGVVAGIL